MTIAMQMYHDYDNYCMHDKLNLLVDFNTEKQYIKVITDQEFEQMLVLNLTYCSDFRPLMHNDTNIYYIRFAMSNITIGCCFL